MQALFCSSAVAALGYGLYSNLKSNVAEEENSATKPIDTGGTMQYFPALNSSVRDMLPMLQQIDAEATQELVQDLERFTLYIASARIEKPPQPLIKAQQIKREITKKLKDLHKQGRRRLPMETSEAAEDFNQIINNMNDQLSNAQLETSLQLQEGVV
jgi:tRNA A37 N6-isopentenylltransferase MiaA